MSLLQHHTIQNLMTQQIQEGSHILSVYLNLDPADAANRRGGYKLVLDKMLREVEAQIEDEEKFRHFQEDANWARQKVELHLPKGKSLALFCDVSESFFLQEDLPIPMASQAWFGETPYVRPLLQARDEHERYGVVLADRERARFFVITIGDIEEVSDIFQSPPFRHRSTAGSDHMRSQMTLQRRAATWSNWFLKDVSDTLHDISQEYDIDRILLAGPEEITAELQRLLPKSVASRVMERLRMPANAKVKEVLELSYPVIMQVEKDRERYIVDDLITMARKTKSADKAVLGFSSVLSTINQGRVYRLIYSSGLKMAGYRCASCDVLLDHAPENLLCPYCSKQLEERSDMVWLALERVLNMGGSVEEIRSEEVRADLDAAGKIGAFLR
ncbi:MAG: hypothetical protein RBS57_06305 [Desulforhabdus sp.]|jgi:peptide subunit release factor 1 (eRF1)|nr:hypothetical protein [Desulforhabdus sp.]